MDRGGEVTEIAFAPPREPTGRRTAEAARPVALPYRSDIDGLRAIAVLAVVMFHANFLGCRGGYVGVDVFFVISGFLITSIIVGEIDRATFSLARFYERRVRRIFPALFLVLTACCLAGALLFDPVDLKHLGESVVATALFASNILFWIQTGYFDSPADERPLLHTWSLAVEEQFYVVFPLYLLAVSRFFPKQRNSITLALCAISFMSSVLAVHYWPDAAFYLAPMRAWELLIGALIALDLAPQAAGVAIRNLATILGLALVLAAVFAYSAATPFPGVAALLPTVGTALIIWAGIGSSPKASSILSFRPLVFVGKISYSLYLWHFMLLGFASYLSFGHLSVMPRVLTLTLAFALSCISWRYVEQIFRRRDRGFSSSTIAIAGAAATAAFALVGTAAFLSHGFPQRLHGAALAAASGASDFDSYRDRCVFPTVEQVRTMALCELGTRAAVPVSFVLWGDSHAEALSSAISGAAVARGRRGLLAAHVGCEPLAGVESPRHNCKAFNDAVFDLIRRTAGIKEVILDARWSRWSAETRYGPDGEPPIELHWQGTAGIAVGNRKIFALGLDRTLSGLTALNKEIWIIGPAPEIDYDVPRVLYLQSLGFDPAVDIRPSVAEFETREKFVLQTLSAMASKYPVRIIYPDRVLCRTGKCRVSVGGAPAYIDDHHLSVHGTDLIAPIFAPIFPPTLR
ncbi:MAG TPA: acyltransferase family protein [Candidatus Binataceae bacterium]|nr:acyltransferase family protein [Candidatus Binataceae bacterium]